MDGLIPFQLFHLKSGCVSRKIIQNSGGGSNDNSEFRGKWGGGGGPGYSEFGEVGRSLKKRRKTDQLAYSGKCKQYHNCPKALSFKFTCWGKLASTYVSGLLQFGFWERKDTSASEGFCQN